MSMLKDRELRERIRLEGSRKEDRRRTLETSPAGGRCVRFKELYYDLQGYNFFGFLMRYMRPWNSYR